jgi:hypothetical protein
MRIRLLTVVLIAFAATLPSFATTVDHMNAVTAHHRNHYRSHARRAHRSSVAAHHADSIRHALETHAPDRHTAIADVPRVRWVPPLRGSHASLVRQNERDTAEGLVRIEDDAQLDQLEAERDLSPLPASYTLKVNPGLPLNRRYCRPWTARFLADLARVHYARFHRPLQVNSAVRTVAFQRALLEVNGNAAPAEGDVASPHLTGAAVDIGKRGLSFSELAWMRAWLLPMQTAGKIDVEEEFYQSCFHITVYRSYAPPASPLTPRTPRRRRASATLLAARLR